MVPVIFGHCNTVSTRNFGIIYYNQHPQFQTPNKGTEQVKVIIQITTN